MAPGGAEARVVATCAASEDREAPVFKRRVTLQSLTASFQAPARSRKLLPPSCWRWRWRHCPMPGWCISARPAPSPGSSAKGRSVPRPSAAQAGAHREHVITQGQRSAPRYPPPMGGGVLSGRLNRTPEAEFAHVNGHPSGSSLLLSSNVSVVEASSLE